MEKDTYHSRLLTWGIWITGLAAVGFMVADVLVRMPVGWLQRMPVYCLASFAFLHSFTFMGTRRAIWFLALGLILPFVAEYLGTNFGAIFGSHWLGRAQDLRIPVDVMLPGRIPLAAVLTWYGLLYVTFVSAVFLLNAKTSDISAFASVPLAAGLMMALWQLAAGPASIGRHMMGFAQNGFYHGIPMSSFVGWFVTTMFVLLFFQIVEPTTVDANRFREPEQRLAPLTFGLYAAFVGYAALVCFKMNMNGAGWLGVVVILLFALGLLVRTKSPVPVTALTRQPSGAV
jgi:putative membrane protein